MPARLTVYPQDQPARQFSLDPGREHLIGRGPDCDLHVEDKRLSRRHARLAYARDRWHFDDLGSKNGTTLAGRMAGDSALRDGDWISFGGLLGQFSELSEERLAAEQQKARTRWEESFERSRRLDPKTELDLLIQQVLSSSMELAGAERGFVMLTGDDGQMRQRAHAGGVDAASAAAFPGSLGALERARATLKPVVVCDAGADTLLGAQPSVVVGQIRALVCLPLAVGERLTGLLYLDSKSPGKIYTRLDVEILEAFALRAALVIGIAAVREDLDSLPRFAAMPAAGNPP